MDTSATEFLKDLNEEQRSAVTQTDGPMLILAGAGSGKTRTITYKIAHVISQGKCRPEQILAVTFTNKAAAEMRSRVEGILADLDTAPLICTFHSFSARMLRRHAELVGYERDFTICDTDDQKRVLKVVYDQLGLTDSDLSLDRSRRTISRAKNSSCDADQMLQNARDPDEELISRVYTAYQRFLKRSNAMDFDDLILVMVRMLAENPDVRLRYGDWYRYLLIDEYQDTNRPQYDLIQNLTIAHQNISAVGDEDQSIYGFRGADIKNILSFEADFPGATIVKLEQNYRSNQNILDAATAVVSNNQHRRSKVLWTKRPRGEPLELLAAPDAKAEAYYVCQRIHEHLQDGEKGLAVLYRTNFQSRQVEEILRRFQIPYKLVGGVSFYHRKEIKDALAYLRMALNPNDSVSLSRIINVPPRGIGQVTVDRLRDLADKTQATFWQALRSGMEESSFPGRSHLVLERFFNLMGSCRPLAKLPQHLALEKILEESGYVAALRTENSEEAHDRILNLEELITVAKESVEQGSSPQEFLDQAALRSEADDFDQSAEVSLMTLHNAKGLEFPIVFLVGCEEGLFPHARSQSESELEEERRLCYVGLTRAQKRIYLTYSLRRRFYGREGEGMNPPSRFLAEIPGHLVRDGSSLLYPHASELSRPSGTFVRKSFPAKSGGSFQGKTYDSVESVHGFLQKLGGKTGPPDHGFVSGASIIHGEFGQGRILHVQDVGDDLKITVRFPGLGIKKLLQSYAKLKLI